MIREGIQWNNVASGIRRDVLFPALLPDHMTVEPGNIVEKVLGGTPTIRRIRARSLAEGHCRFDEVETGALKALLGTASLVGPSGMATLYCQGIENEGWIKPRTYWHRPPARNTDPAAN